MSERSGGGSPVVSARVPWESLRLAALALERRGIECRTRAEVVGAAVEMVAQLARMEGEREAGVAEAVEWCLAKWPEMGKGRRNVWRAARVGELGVAADVLGASRALRVGAPSVGVVESSHSPSAEEIAAVLREMEGAPLAAGEGTQGDAARREEE